MKASRIAAAGAVAAAAVVVLAPSALAHVSVQPEGTAAQGGYAVVDFKVPNERDDASTTKLEVTFPAEYPLSSVLPEPVPGWRTEVTRSELDKPIESHGRQITEAVTKVTWTATGKGIEPGFFQKFPVSVGALPDTTDELVFKALQTYSNDEVVRWIEVPREGQEEPDNPAPVLALSAATGDHHGSAAGADEEPAADAANANANASASASATSTASEGSGDSTDTTARVLGVVGIAVGAAGVAYGVLAGRRRDSATGATTST